MRLRVLLAATGIAMLSGSGVPQAGAQSVGEDSVVGSAEGCEVPFPCDFRSFDVTVDVRSGPDGENATGSLNLGHGSGFGTYSVDAQASCLAVSGNVAVVGFAGTYRQLTPAFEVPVVGFLRVSDGGDGVGQDSFEWSLEPSVAPGPTVCPASPPGGLPSLDGSGLNDQGDLVVHDAPALPTSKDQCKNGGWKTFGVFKNQGDCVSLVATGGRNLPSGP
jgi:hypothetical protein